MLVISPHDDPLNLFPLKSITVGTSAHSGLLSRDRFLAAAMLAALSSADMVSLVEYDTLVLPGYRDVCPVAEDTVYCNYVFTNCDPKFSSSHYTHWPVSATPATWGRIARAGAFVYEGGMSDRWLAASVESAGLKYQQVATGDHYSANHIDAEKIDAACAAVERGALALHGIKDKATFERLVTAYNKGIV